MVESRSICFCFPYHEESGVPILFARMANALAAKEKDRQIYVIDYADGATARNLLPLENIHLIVFEDGKTVTPPRDAILVMQSFVPYYWPKELTVEPETRLFFWSLHPDNFVPSLLPLPGLRYLPGRYFGLYKALSVLYPGLLGRLRQFVRLLNAHHALSFMDQTNADATARHLFLDVEVDSFLPVPAENRNPAARKDAGKSLDQGLSFCWVGRLANEKANILAYTLHKLSSLASELNQKMVYHIVGGGPSRAYLEENAPAHAQFEVVFHGAIDHRDLDAFLLKEVDIMTAMGTSALEGAKLGIPTILLDYSSLPVKKDYRFRFLFDTINYDLGHLITDRDFSPGNTTLRDMVLAIKKDYSLYSTKSRSYFDNSHDLAHVVELFAGRVGASTLTFGAIEKKIFKKPSLLVVYNKLRGLKT
ncbi:MAG TPA: glycosyltransferase [Dinghuibacter sp.]|uniref:glycosyltransferase n=1 Tax=Dinghuibacter sp. TaxID=2024697 RepID=UPI002CF7E761|nr:glycosyltransferase [Dinghuibacter sp.]HTJ10966.1 glycosyltransferase [Dinghuibacter sp.]